jgi:hypothetical protein
MFGVAPITNHVTAASSVSPPRGCCCA